MTAQQADRMRDEATIARMTETSHSGDEREFLRDCKYCQAPFWVRSRDASHGITQAAYCCASHRVMAWYWSHHAHVLARQKRYQARRRAERAA